MCHVRLCLLHLPPLLHPFILGDVPLKHLPPPLLKHVGEWQCGHDGECLFQEEVDLSLCKKTKTTKYLKLYEEKKSGILLLLVQHTRNVSFLLILVTPADKKHYENHCLVSKNSNNYTELANRLADGLVCFSIKLRLFHNQLKLP